MKNLKTILILACLLITIKTNTVKRYSNGKIANVFDVAILLEETPIFGPSHEESIANKGKLEKLIIIKELRNFILQEEAIIVSAPLMRGLLKAKDKKYINNKYKEAYEILIKNYIGYLTPNKSFLVLIPLSKYKFDSRIKSGLNNSSKNIIPKNYNLKILLDIINKKNEKKGLNINELTNIFSGQKHTNIRAYLTGHGSKQKETIANLTQNQFRSLRDKLDESGCSLLYVSTCFGGGNVASAQTLFFNPSENTSSKKELSSKKFIEITEGITGESVSGIKNNISTFFLNINDFFSKKMEQFKKTTEQEMLSGSLEYKPLIEREPKIKESISFKNIFEGFILKNIPRVRFPRDKNMNYTNNISEKSKTMQIQDRHFKSYSKILSIPEHITNIIVDSAIINGTIIINALYSTPKIYVADEQIGHTYIKKIIFKNIDYHRKSEKLLKDFLIYKFIPKKMQNAKSLFISEVIFKTLNHSVELKNIFIYKKNGKKTVYFQENGEYKKYINRNKSLECVSYKKIELKILKKLGETKPKTYIYPNKKTALNTLFENIKTITKFKQKDYKKNIKDYKFVAKYIKYHLDKRKRENTINDFSHIPQNQFHTLIENEHEFRTLGKEETRLFDYSFSPTIDRYSPRTIISPKDECEAKVIKKYKDNIYLVKDESGYIMLCSAKNGMKIYPEDIVTVTHNKFEDAKIIKLITKRVRAKVTEKFNDHEFKTECNNIIFISKTRPEQNINVKDIVLLKYNSETYDAIILKTLS